MDRRRDEYGAFVQRFSAAPTVDDVRDIFLQATSGLGFNFAALFTPRHPANASQQNFSFHRLPRDWLGHYVAQRYYEIDPVYAAVRRETTPFVWDVPAYRGVLSKRQKLLLDETTDAGLTGGLVIPITARDAYGCCVLTPDTGGVGPEAYATAHSIAVMAYECARRLVVGVEETRAPRLSQRERQCLLLAARGKSDWAIGEMLGLAERTIHHAIERAKRRLGVATRVQAIVRAIHLGEFSAEETIE